MVTTLKLQLSQIKCKTCKELLIIGIKKIKNNVLEQVVNFVQTFLQVGLNRNNRLRMAVLFLTISKRLTNESRTKVRVIIQLLRNLLPYILVST